MCIIIHKPEAKQTIPDYVLDNSERINQDGFGITYLDGNYETIKTRDYVEARELVTVDRPFVAHYRFATVGEVTIDNCHPFPVRHLLRRDSVLYSNGTIAGLGNKDTTDTEVMASMLSACPRSQWENILAMTDVRFAIANGAKCERFGEWITEDGIHYSKRNVLAKPAPPKPACHKSAWYSGNTGFTPRTKHKPFKRAGYAAARAAGASPDIAKRQAGRAVTSEFVSSSEVIRAIERGETSKPSRSRWDTDPRSSMGFEHGDWQGHHYVAVYGTLKDGFSNHGVLGSAEFIGNGVIDEPAALVGATFPYLIENHTDLWSVEVEVYKVDNKSDRVAVDQLEGQPYHYQRIKKMIDMDNGVKLKCWVYSGEDTMAFRLKMPPISYGVFLGPDPLKNRSESERFEPVFDDIISEQDLIDDMEQRELDLIDDYMGEQYGDEMPSGSFGLWGEGELND